VATISYTSAHGTDRFSHGSVVFTWTPLTENDTAQVLDKGGSSDCSIQVSGDFNGGTWTLEGSNDGTNYVTLKDLEGSDITLAAAGIVSIRENVRYLRPKTPSGTGMSLTITLLAKAVR